ncbi:MAG: DNA polymerase I, partial [Phycisphaerales bacterium]|nr:DNA polymerase I [Phycisphaerales bacterium]
MKTLYLIDGHAQFFRAFHAIRTPMTSPVTKEPTNATFGFVGMLLKLLRQLKPDYLAVAIDVGKDTETFRSALYPEYKAHREAPPETFGPQVDRCIGLLREIGVPVLAAPGFEADDVIATLATRLTGTDPDLKVRIVSKDKDLEQLLAPGRVEMYDVHTDALIDTEALRREKGVGPEQVIDMLTLMGDTADNVPGVPGVGPKTAAELIAQYGSLDNLLAHAGEIKGKRGENLRAAAPQLELSRRLITLRHDVPVDFALGHAEVARMPLERLRPILKELGFNRYQDELRALLGEGPAATHGGPAAAPAAKAVPAGGAAGGAGGG